MNDLNNGNPADEVLADDLIAEVIAAEKQKPTLLQKLASFFSHPHQKQELRELEELPEFRATVEPAMARLTDELIEEMIGPDGELTRLVRELMEGHNRNTNPISPEKVRSRIKSMLDLAVARRKLLNERLERSVEVGELYSNYYGRVHAVTALGSQAHTDLERMDLAEEDFRYNYGVMMNVRDKSLEPDTRPKNQILEKVLEIRMKMNTREDDIMRELDERGGG